MTRMNHWERIRAALQGKETDRVPIALWRHWPPDDETPETLATSTINWQKTYDWDIVKITPDGTYGIQDWGGKSQYTSNDNGVYTVIKEGVTSADQWPELKQLDVTQDHLGQGITSVRLIAKEINHRVPILQTVFSPLTTARKLAGERVYTHMRQSPEKLKKGLQIIAETHTRFILECLKAGADGVFFATQCDSYRLTSEAEYREFGEPYDRYMLDAVRPHAEVIMIHAHGMDIMFDLFNNYPADAINWHDQITPPSLCEGMQRFKGMIVGGVNEWHTLLKGPGDAIKAEIQASITQTRARRFMLAPGCVVPINTPPSHLAIARHAVDNL